MIWYPHSSLLMVLLALLMNLGNIHQISSKKCGRDGPPIQFPFYRIDRNTNHSDCLEGFGISCMDKEATMLKLPGFPSPVSLQVLEIDYQSQNIAIFDPEYCLPLQFLKINQSSNFHSHFEVATGSVTFFNCSSSSKYQGGSSYLEYQGGSSSSEYQSLCPIQVQDSSTSVSFSMPDGCTKMFDVKTDIGQFSMTLRWSTGEIDSLTLRCWTDEIESPTSQLRSRILIPSGGIIGLILVVIALFYIYNHYKTKGEDQARVEKFLEDYRSERPTRFSYADIKRITNGFKDKLGEGAHGAVFKGKLSDKILVAVKILNNTEGDGKEFINEVGAMGKIHHINVVRLLGYCADGFHRAFIYDFFPNGSLQNFISPPDNKQIFLGWEKLEKIALGVAKGIEYLHQGCDQRILHFDINPHNVLLDDNLTPKVSDFGLAKLCPKNQSTISITAARGTLGYIAPEVFSRNFGHVSYKSDIYSYGMLLLEMVGGRKNTSTSQETSRVLYPEWIHNLLEGQEDIRIHIENEGDIKIAKKLAIVGLCCIQWHPANRPSIRNVLQMLEVEGGNLKIPPNPFDSSTSSSTSAIIPARHLEMELEVIHESE